MTLPPVPLGLLEDLGQLVPGTAVALVQPVAVGGLHEQIVGLLDDLGVADDRLVRLAHVAAEEHLDLLPLLFELQFQERRAQDVAGIVEHDRHARERAGPAASTPPA